MTQDSTFASSLLNMVVEAIRQSRTAAINPATSLTGLCVPLHLAFPVSGPTTL